MRREYPAYGRTLATHIVRGQKPICIGVLLSSRWHYFDHVPKICIRPDEWALGRYEFSYLRGLHVVAVPGDDASELQLAELLVDLMRIGPRLLWVFNADGSKFYDEDFPPHWTWVLELALRGGGRDLLSRDAMKAAEAVMYASQQRATESWRLESERIQARGDLEAWTRWAMREWETKDRVRELFASPWEAPGDARAA